MATAVPFRFDSKNASAQRVAERIAAAMVTEVSDETRAALRTLIARAIREGIPVYDAARILQSMIGLTTQQAQAAMTYREALINSGLTLQRVEQLAQRYIAKALRRRAETIARTEIMGALNTGQLEAWGQAQGDGQLGPGASKTWLVTPDDRLCPSCAPMDNVTVLLAAKFSTPLGPVDGPPLHPNCRCAIAANA